MFAGLATGSEPFTLNAGPPTTLTYNGDTGMMTREVEEGVTMSVNIPGSTGFPAIIQSLIDLRDGLQNNDSAASRRPSAISTPREHRADPPRPGGRQGEPPRHPAVAAGLHQGEPGATALLGGGRRLRRATTDLATRQTAFQASLAAARASSSHLCWII